MRKKRPLLYILALSILSAAACVGAVNVNAYPDDEEVSQESFYFEESSETFESSEYTEISKESSYGEESSIVYQPDESSYYEESSEYVWPYTFDESSSYSEFSSEESSGLSEMSGEESSFQPSVFYVDGEPSEESSEESSETTSANEISGYEYSDNQTLTSKDWENLKRDNAPHLEISIAQGGGNDNAIKKIKENESNSNDDWVYLMWGLILIGAGVITIIITVVVSVLYKNKGRGNAAANAKYYKNYYQNRTPSGTNSGTQPTPHNRPFINQDTSDIDISSHSSNNKDDYKDLY